jgi:hypothetical protein
MLVSILPKLSLANMVGFRERQIGGSNPQEASWNDSTTSVREQNEEEEPYGPLSIVDLSSLLHVVRSALYQTARFAHGIECIAANSWGVRGRISKTVGEVDSAQKSLLSQIREGGCRFSETNCFVESI